jgi:hypothetical protein
MVFCFVQNFFFGQHESYNINFFCRTKREFVFQELTLGYITKTLNQIIFFSSTKIRIFFLEKNHNPPHPPFQLNGCSLRVWCCLKLSIFKYGSKLKLCLNNRYVLSLFVWLPSLLSSLNSSVFHALKYDSFKFSYDNFFNQIFTFTK